MTNLNQKQLAAFRHLVLDDLLVTLPYASADQVNKFLINLGLYSGGLGKLGNDVGATAEDPFADSRARGRIQERLICDRFLDLRVSPDISETSYKAWPEDLRMKYLTDRYGEDLLQFAGFYREGSGRIRLNLPKGCALYAYRSRLGLYNGILCQPLWTDGYYLLSSSKYGGAKAIRLTDADAALFDAGVVTFRKTPPGPRDASLEEVRQAA